MTRITPVQKKDIMDGEILQQEAKPVFTFPGIRARVIDKARDSMIKVQSFIPKSHLNLCSATSGKLGKLSAFLVHFYFAKRFHKFPKSCPQM